MKKKLYGLDHLRALAIVLVFMFHYYILTGGKPAWLPTVASFGWTGVDLFFVLSGFLISAQLFKQIKAGVKISFKEFFLKRFFRIIPAYLFVVALYFIIPFFREKESLPPLWKFLTFTQNLYLNVKDQGTFSHCWSLCVEEHFYLILPLLLILLQSLHAIKKSYWILITLFAIGFVIRYYSYNNLYIPNSQLDDSWMYWYKYIYYPTYNRLDGLLVGVSIACVYEFLPAVWSKILHYGNLLVALGLFVLISAYFLCEDQTTFYASVFGFPLVAIGYGLIVMGAICSTNFLYKWNSKITTTIATLSYAIYLTHKGVIHITHKLLESFSLNENVLLILCAIMCVCFGYVLHIIVEKPFMQLRKRILEKK